MSVDVGGGREVEVGSSECGFTRIKRESEQIAPAVRSF